MAQKASKSEFVRSQPPSMSNAAVAEAAQIAGLKISPSYVANVRWHEKQRTEKPANTNAPKRKKAVRKAVAKKPAATKQLTKAEEIQHTNEFLAMFSPRGEIAVKSFVRQLVRRELREMLGASAT